MIRNDENRTAQFGNAAGALKTLDYLSSLR